VSKLLLTEPLGVMQLSAICKKRRWQTRLAALNKHDLVKAVKEFDPQILAYNTLTADESLFLTADSKVREWLKRNNRSLLRIMGGPHPTYFPEILDKCDLDAVCVGEGDHAMETILARVEEGAELDGIPNILTEQNRHWQKEVAGDLDSLPYMDRAVYYEAAPHLKRIGLRSFLTSRGCPYGCTYCFNNAFNKMFRGCGPILRRRSVEHVIGEIKYVQKYFPPLQMVRFADDTFAHKVDDWLIEFLGRYKKEIGLPFYCLMRSNTLSEDMAKLLRESGCISLAMAVESGNERVRNEVLKRNLSDAMVIRSFENARKYGLKTFGNTMLALPGTTLSDDWQSVVFAKKLKLTVPTFGIFCPFPRTELAQYATDHGLLNEKNTLDLGYGRKSVLNCYTEKEKDVQLRLAYLASIFCALPDFFLPVLKRLVNYNLTRLYSLLGSLFVVSATAIHIFRPVISFNPLKIMRIALDYWKYQKQT